MTLYSGSVMLIQVYGVEDLLTPGCIVACSNMQWRADDRGGVCPSLTVSDVTVFSLNPRDPHLRSAVNKFTSTVQVTFSAERGLMESLLSSSSGTHLPGGGGQPRRE